MSALRLADETDRFLLQLEMNALRRRGFRFDGATAAEKLGVDAWVLGVKVVEEKRAKRKGDRK